MTSIYQKDELSPLADKVIIITGAKGMLGLAFREMISEYAATVKLYEFGRSELDVTKLDQVLTLESLKPDFIIHCASLVNADYCEENLGEATDVIVTGARNILTLAKMTHSKVMFPQSFLVYDGKQLPITERVKPNPLSVYGKLKLEAEEIFAAELPETLIVRMAGFFGGQEVDKNFVGKFISHITGLIEKGVDSMDVGDRVWQPTYTNDLAYNSLVLLAQNSEGIYCMASIGQASFFELSKEIIKVLGLNDKFKVNPVVAAAVSGNEKALRPERAILQNKRLVDEGLDRQRSWQEGIAEYLSRPYFKNLIKNI